MARPSIFRGEHPGVHGLMDYSLGPALRKRNVKKRGPDLARRRAKKNTEPVRVWAVAEQLVSRFHFSLKILVARSS